MIRSELLEILLCQVCLHENKGQLDLHRDAWLVCRNCGRKYPIIEDIPVMLIEEGDKWANTAVDQLPVPPPNA